jgi:hypothetical protein
MNHNKNEEDFSDEEMEDLESTPKRMKTLGKRVYNKAKPRLAKSTRRIFLN